MLQKIEKLVEVFTKLLELAIIHIEKDMAKAGGAPSETAGDQSAAPEPKKERKARAPKEETAKPADPIEDQLGLGSEEAPKKEEAPVLSGKELQAKVEEVTKHYVALCKNDKPGADGKNPGSVRAIELLSGVFKAKALPALTDAQKLEWVATMEKWTAEHK